MRRPFSASWSHAFGPDNFFYLGSREPSLFNECFGGGLNPCLDEFPRKSLRVLHCPSESLSGCILMPLLWNPLHNSMAVSA